MAAVGDREADGCRAVDLKILRFSLAIPKLKQQRANDKNLFLFFYVCFSICRISVNEINLTVFYIDVS